METLTCCILVLCCPAVKEGGSHSFSRSTLMNSSMVSWLVGVSSNSVNLRGGGAVISCHLLFFGSASATLMA